MTQHPHKAVIDQWTDDPSREIECWRDLQRYYGIRKGSAEWYSVPPKEVIDDIHGNFKFRIKPKPHPNDKYREAFERGERVWRRYRDTGGRTAVTKTSNPNWNFKTTSCQYSLTDPNPVDPYAHKLSREEVLAFVKLQLVGEHIDETVTAEDIDEELLVLANMCYQAGMDKQRESDAKIANNMMIGEETKMSKQYDLACAHVMNAILDNKGD